MKPIPNAILLRISLTVTVAWADSDRQAVQDAVNSLQATIQARQSQIAASPEPTALQLQQMKDEVEAARSEFR